MKYVSSASTAVVGWSRTTSSERRLEEQFHESQKLEAVGRLAGGVAHDFNNVLQIIILVTDDLVPQLTPTAHFDHLKQVLDASWKDASLTRQLFAFSRKQVLQPVVLDLNESVAGIDKLLRRLIGEDVEFVTRCEPRLGYVGSIPGRWSRSCSTSP